MGRINSFPSCRASIHHSTANVKPVALGGKSLNYPLSDGDAAVERVPADGHPALPLIEGNSL